MPKADDEARREHRENRRTHRLNDNDLTPLKRARGYGDADKEEGEGISRPSRRAKRVQDLDFKIQDFCNALPGEEIGGGKDLCTQNFQRTVHFFNPPLSATEAGGEHGLFTKYRA